MAPVKVIHASTPYEEMEMPPGTVNEVLEAFKNRRPKCKNCHHGIVRLNGTFVPKEARDTTRTKHGDVLQLTGGKVRYLREGTIGYLI